MTIDSCILTPLQWRHNGRDSVSNHQPHDCLLNGLFRRRSKKTSKLRVTGLCAGNSLGTDEFPTQLASYAEHVSIWWRHHAMGSRQNGWHLLHGIFKCIFFNENCFILIQISVKVVPSGSINNNPALVQIMAWRRWTDRPLFGLMMA